MPPAGASRIETLRYKTYLLLLLMVLFGPLGDMFLRDGMARIGVPFGWSLGVLLRFFYRTFTSGPVWLGILLLIGFFLAYMAALSGADFSYVQPASALAYGIVAVFGFFFLGETVAPIRWAGVGLICAGVLIVGNTSPRTTEAPASASAQKGPAPAAAISSRGGDS